MITYRNLQKKDIENIRKVALNSWKFAYENIYIEKTMRKTINKYYSDDKFIQYFEEIKNNKGKYIVAVESNEIIGFSYVCKKKSIWEVTRIFLDPKHLRKGIGSTLIKKTELFLKKNNVKSYILYPHVKNKIAVNFYKKVGFLRHPQLDEGWKSPCFIKKI